MFVIVAGASHHRYPNPRRSQSRPVCRACDGVPDCKYKKTKTIIFIFNSSIEFIFITVKYAPGCVAPPVDWTNT